MKRFIGPICVAMVISLMAVSVTAQTADDDKEARRARKKQSRRLLKSAIKKAEAGQYAPALSELDSILFMDEANPDAFYYKGIIFIHAGDTAQALEALEIGAEKAPLARRLRILLARLLIEKSEHDRALEIINSVLAIKPREGEALYLKGIILHGKGDNQGAIESFKKSLEQATSRGGMR